MKGGMQQLMKQAQQMQKKMEKMQEDLEAMQVEASAGGGMVTAHVNGKKRLVKLDIDKGVVDPNDVEMLQDLLLAAVNDALAQVKKMEEERMGALTGGLGLPPGLF